MDEEQLIKDNLGLIGLFISRNPRPNGVTKEEYEIELKLALWQSIRSYKPELGALSSYAMRNMLFARNGLVRGFARWARYGTESGLESAYRESDQIDLDNEPDFPFTLKECISILNESEREVIGLFLAGKSFTQLAKDRGVSRQACNRMYWHSIEKMRRAFNYERSACG